MNYYTYHFYVGSTVVHGGITTDPRRRESEHRQKPGWSRGRLHIVGGPMTEAQARQWEKDNGYS